MSLVLIMIHCLAMVGFVIKIKLRKSEFKKKTPWNLLRYYQMLTCKIQSRLRIKLSLLIYFKITDNNLNTRKMNNFQIMNLTQNMFTPHTHILTEQPFKTD